MRRRLPLMLLLTTVTLNAVAQPLEEELPKWEAGLGVGAVSIPDYRGSDRRTTYVLPIPYFAYRGDTFKVDREGAHADVFESNTVKLDISLSIGPPAKSEDDGARAGMPDIDPTVEAGAAVKVIFWKDDRQDNIWSLRFPLRAVVTTGADYIGWVFVPNLHYRKYDFLGFSGWEFSTSLGPTYGSEKYHDYYYEVAPEYATATRPAYDAKGGYGGTQMGMGLSKRFPRMWVGAYVRYDYLRGAVYDDSPLIRRNDSLIVGGGISWVFAKSDKIVKVPREVFK